MSNIDQASGTHQAAGDPRDPVIQPAGLLYDRLLTFAGGLLLDGIDNIYGARDEEVGPDDFSEERGPWAVGRGPWFDSVEEGRGER